MRLWHQSLLHSLPRQQLLGQHRECCALRGNGWGRKHATVDYVFTHSPYKLFQYHLLVMEEMKKQNYKPGEEWFDPLYRGKICEPYPTLSPIEWTSPLYPEHDQIYLAECVANLEQKGIIL
ncbi:TIGR02328 family protein [Enterococcus mundtii]|nr:TIGR02328 family protein [Enterococcus mundtii]OBS61965.1 hypothetical protein AX758_02575 [Enterococcus mundtii]PQC28446.1 hypothetical protein CUM97_13335 [Enterococcus mundtii]